MRDDVDNVLAVTECKRVCIRYEHIIIKPNTGWHSSPHFHLNPLYNVS